MKTEEEIRKKIEELMIEPSGRRIKHETNLTPRRWGWVKALQWVLEPSFENLKNKQKKEVKNANRIG